MESWYIIALTIGLIIVLLIGFLIWFYREPSYSKHTYVWSIPENGKYVDEPNILYAPSYGTVSNIVMDKDKDLTTVSIFLNVFDIHRQYCPCAGKIISTKYHLGQFNNAMYFEKSSDNESMETIIQMNDKDKTQIVVKQIAGLLARVIELDENIKENNQVEQGQYLGIIKFGSRVNITFPSSKYVLQMKEGSLVNGLDTKFAIRREIN